MRPLYLALGLLSVALGIIGIALPLLPTVPFFILAAFCFARSSPRLEQRLLDDPRIGPSIKLWREKGAISRKGKTAALIAFAISIGLSLAFVPLPWSLTPVAVALITGTWIWTRPEN